jgi:hypothetical protein
MISVVKYNPELQQTWNRVVYMCKNSTFLHLRSFMDYHQDRYRDESYLVFDDMRPVALFPANRRENGELVSHEGLTYGGFLLKSSSYSRQNLLYFHAFMQYLHDHGTRTVLFKQVPAFYCRESSDEIDYALDLMRAEVYRADISSCISLHTYHRLPFQKRRQRMISKALKRGLYVLEVDEFASFWDEALIPNLWERHGVAPVHTREEMASLYRNNPGCIRQFNVYEQGRIMGGSTVFDTKTTAHAQYIAATKEGKECGALDYLFSMLIGQNFASKEFFDFGTVNENAGKTVNGGLLDWKEGFGARAYLQRFYRIDTGESEAILSALS